MADPDLFAVLTAHGCSPYNFASEKNQPYYQLPSNDVPPHISSRETTPLWSEFMHQHSWKNNHRLELRLSDPLKDPTKGWSIGNSSSSCDIKLEDLCCVSRKQFFITMRDDFVPILMDRGSKNGTAVSYQGIGGEQFRSKDRWVLALPPSENDHDIEVIIHIRLCNYKLKIEFPNHASKDVEHLDKLERFVDNRRVIVPIIESLGLRNTAITTSASTLDEDEGPLYIRISEIGLGSSATVWKVFNSRDGGVFAAKVFKPPEQKRGAEISWKANIHNEVNIMKENVHFDIMPVVHFISHPNPILVMPFYSLGSLETYTALKAQNAVALCQVLQATWFLHDRGVAHRDIKPANILIVSERPFKITLSDFGLSKRLREDNLLVTFCGTHMYMAPEVAAGKAAYDSAVDIWSIGVVFLEAFWNLPKFPNKIIQEPLDRLRYVISRKWSKKVIKHLADIKSDPIADILWWMLQINGRDRPSAQVCIRKGEHNGLWYWDNELAEYVLEEEFFDSITAQDHRASPNQRTIKIEDSEPTVIVANLAKIMENTIDITL